MDTDSLVCMYMSICYIKVQNKFHFRFGKKRSGKIVLTIQNQFHLFAIETFRDSLNYIFKHILSHCGTCSNQTYDHAVNRSPRKVSKPQIDSKQFRTCKTLLQGQIINPVNGIILIIRGINVHIVSDACGPKKYA